jgi:hypothetical protein
MAGPDPAIQVFVCGGRDKAWMPATSAGMTVSISLDFIEPASGHSQSMP